MAGVSQLERDLIRMRQHEGIELVKKEEKLKGRLKKYHDAVKLYKEENMIVNQMCEMTNVCRASIYRNYRKGIVDGLYQKSQVYNRK